MSRLMYSATVSLDGYFTDRDGRIDFAEPSEEVHAYVNDHLRGISTFLFGRRLYETMVVWETLDDPAPVMRDFAAIWHAADKVVYSHTMTADDVHSARTRVESEFDPAAIARLKSDATGDIEVGGADLGGQAIRAGLVDDIHLYVAPVLLGGGTRYFPDDVRLELELVAEHRFENGTVHLQYRTAG